MGLNGNVGRMEINIPVGGVSCARIYGANLAPELFQKSGVLWGLDPPPAHSPVGALLVHPEGVKKLSCNKTNSAMKSCKTLFCFESDFKVIS